MFKSLTRVFVAVLCVSFVAVAVAQVKSSDSARLEKAREQHQKSIAQATERYEAAVTQANEQLTRLYEYSISSYESANDAEAAATLRGELESALALASSGAAASALAADGEGAKESANYNQEIIKLLGPSLVMANKQKVNTQSLSEVPHVLLYFSAGWCPPCRKFTPSLVEFFNNQKASKRVVVVFVSSDQNEKDMFKYMTDYKMTFPRMPYEQIARSGIKGKYPGRGIPNLILLNPDGTVRSGSYEGDNYVGPNKVLRDTIAVLEQEGKESTASAAR